MRAAATVHGAVSLVNAIAARKGATLGIDLEVTATIDSRPGTGIAIESENISTRLAKATVRRSVPAAKLECSHIAVSVKSGIPAGYGLKSSSAISSAISLACHRLFRPGSGDRRILLAGVEASIESKVSITGAYDDACSCYYGGFNVTDNEKRRRVRFGRAPRGLHAVIFVPKKRRRRAGVKKLADTPEVFGRAWKAAKRGDYWDAMNINGMATAPVLGSDPALMASLLDAGALGASVSGNGPAVAAIARGGDVSGIRRIFGRLEGRTITSKVSNKKATVHEV